MTKPWRPVPGLLISASLLLASCHEEHVTPADAAWLPGADGAVLRFHNDTLGEQTVRLRRSEAVNKLPGQTGDHPYQTITLVYQADAAPRVNLSVSSSFEYVTFARADSLGSGLYYAQLVARESVSSQGLMQAELLKDTTFRGRPYDRLLHARLRPGTALGPMPIVAFYYSRTEGLVGYRTSQRRVWWRVF